jgi:hypothetical protein
VLLVPKESAIEALIEEITVDAHDVDEQLMGFLQVFLDEVVVPTPATLLDIVVEVAGFDSEGDERRGLVAHCRHGDRAGTVSLADLRFDPHSIAGWLHAAYRTWLCLPPFPARRPANWSRPS